jgi:TonB family protein
VARDTARAAAAPGAARSAARPPAPAAADTARRIVPKGAMIPLLPETLAVAVPGRESRYAPATLMDEPRCDYPEAAREAGVQGRVWVLALVDIDGTVMRAQLQSGIPVLNQVALACVRGWRFQPRTWQDAPCRYRVLVPVAFTAH